MRKTNLSKVLFGIAILGALGTFSINQLNAVCAHHQTKKICLQDKKCEWEEDVPVPECSPEKGAKAECWGWDKKKCLANLKNGCSWYVGCRDKEK